VLLAGAAVGGTYIVQRRLAAQAFVNVGTAVLTAQPMPVGSADAGVVTDILVKERESVTAGADVAKIMLPPNGTSKEPRTQTLKAPASGIVTDVAVDVGGVARAGEPVITLYDPTKLTFLAEVPLDKLRQLRLGMTTYVEGAGLNHRVATTLQDVVPQVGTDPTPADSKLTVVLVPDRSEMATVQRLVPGLRFDAVADTKTAPGGIQAVNSA
jgi:multidrug resistance efflux pump